MTTYDHRGHACRWHSDVTQRCKGLAGVMSPNESAASGSPTEDGCSVTSHLPAPVEADPDLVPMDDEATGFINVGAQEQPPAAAGQAAQPAEAPGAIHLCNDAPSDQRLPAAAAVATPREAGGLLANDEALVAATEPAQQPGGCEYPPTGDVVAPAATPPPPPAASSLDGSSDDETVPTATESAHQPTGDAEAQSAPPPAGPTGDAVAAPVLAAAAPAKVHVRLAMRPPFSSWFRLCAAIAREKCAAVARMGVRSDGLRVGCSRSDWAAPTTFTTAMRW